MLPIRITQNENRINSIIKTMDLSVDEVDLRIQNIFANHLVLAASGHVELSVLTCLAEYGRKNGNNRIARFVDKSISRNNSLNCEKIETILHQFDKNWWPQVVETTSVESRTAIDSLKTLRDQIAHGKPNGTGYTIVKDYYGRSKRFISDLNSVILP